MRHVRYRDAAGRPTDDPAAAVRGDGVDYDGHGRPRRVTLFAIHEHHVPRLPVSEPAFLLWVLVALICVWLIVGLALGLT